MPDMWYIVGFLLGFILCVGVTCNEWEKVFTAIDSNRRNEQKSHQAFGSAVREQASWMNKPLSKKCQKLDSSALLRRLKDEGDFNPTYMASNFNDAADRFEDLAQKQSFQSPKRKFCNAHCEKLRREYVQRLNRTNRLPPPDQVELMPDLSNRVERISNAGLNFARFKMDQAALKHGWTSGGGRQQQPAASIPPIAFFNSFFRRSKRGAQDSQAFGLAEKSTDADSIGSENVIYCWKAGNHDASSGLHRMCSACRSLRRMPPEYFPPYINEVLCQGDECLSGQGQCVQQYIELNVLKNVGSRDCEEWVRHVIKVSVCCDCMLRTNSVLFQQILSSANAPSPGKSDDDEE